MTGQPTPDVLMHPCPTCDGQRCERCDATGRAAWLKVYADNTLDGRAALELWFGAAATKQRIAVAPDLGHDWADLILATLAEAPGVVIRDRRGR